MTKGAAIKKIIYDVLADGEIHSATEIRSKAIESGIMIDEKSTSLRNAIYHIKREDANFKTVDRGMYVLTSTTSGESVICFEEALRIIETEITKLRNIKCLTCSEQELSEARNKVRELKKMQSTIHNLLK